MISPPTDPLARAVVSLPSVTPNSAAISSLKRFNTSEHPGTRRRLRLERRAISDSPPLEVSMKSSRFFKRPTCFLAWRNKENKKPGFLRVKGACRAAACTQYPFRSDLPAIRTERSPWFQGTGRPKDFPHQDALGQPAGMARIGKDLPLALKTGFIRSHRHAPSRLSAKHAFRFTDARH